MKKLILFISVLFINTTVFSQTKTFDPKYKCSYSKGKKSCVTTNVTLEVNESSMEVDYGNFTEKYSHGELKSSTQLEMYNQNETINIYFATPKRQKITKIHIQPIIGSTIIYSTNEKEL